MKIEKGMKVLVTGAGSGIGRSVSVALARRGANLFLTDINAAGLAETAELVKKAGGMVGKIQALDVSKFEQVKSFAEDISKESGAMDILMNVAGVALFALIEDMSHADWEKVINVNLWGPIHVLESFAPEMIKAKKGHILNVASIAGLVGGPWHAAYSTSKSGLVGLSEVLRYDLMQHNIGVTVICPGAVETPLKQSTRILGVDMESEEVKELKEKFSERAVSPERVVELMLDAVEKNKFIVLTSFDVKLLYFLKYHFFQLYHYAVKQISRMINAIRYPEAKRA